MKEELRKYTVKNLNYSLALESYEDNMGVSNEVIESAWKLLSEYRKKRDSLPIEEQLEMVKEISKRFDLAVEEVGRENFIFYDDGDINYIWKGGKDNE